MKEYYVTWAEKKFGGYFNYIRMIRGNSVKDVKELMQLEQNERRLTGKPHMFTIRITKTRPGDDFLEKYNYKRGHLYY